MAGKGPPRTPTPILRLRGSPLADLRTDEPIPEAEGEIVRPDADLRPGALEVWDSRAPGLERAGVLTAWDVEAFTLYCNYSVELRDGVAKRRRLKQTREAFLFASLKTLRAYFGLDPADRGSIKATPKRVEAKGGKAAYFK